MVRGEAALRGRGRPQDRQQRRLRGRREKGGGEAREQREECSSDDQINLTNVKPRLKVVKNLMFPSFSKSHISPLNSKTVHCGHGTVGLEFKSSQNI